MITAIHPPHVIRGCDSQNEEKRSKISRIGVHWLRGSFPKQFMDDILALLQDYFGEPNPQNKGRWYYKKSYLFANNVTIQYYDEMEDKEYAAMMNGRFTVDIPGRALDELKPDDIIFIVNRLKHFGFSCTRVDIFFDDAERIITPRELQPLADLNHMTGFLRGRIERDTGHYADNEDMMTFGRRGNIGSGSYLRVYDKTAESDGVIDAIRWELELSNKKAKKFFSRISAGYGDILIFETHIREVIGGCIDFRDKSVGDKNLGRCPRYSFWERILSMLGAAKITIERVKTAVDRAKKWIFRQTIGSLQMCHEVFGSDFISQLVTEIIDRNRLRPEHHNAIAAFRRHRAIYEGLDSAFKLNVSLAR